MLMYMFHIAFALGLIALMFGISMYKCCKSCGCCKTSSCDVKSSESKCDTACGSKCCSKWVSMIIVILATISLLCTLHAGYMHWKMGSFGQGMVMNLDVVDITPAPADHMGQPDHMKKAK